MRVEFLGTGGAFPVPRPGCGCAVCVEALAEGVPYRRSGPSVFLHGAEVLFDTPEESREQLARARIGRVAACFYSHWHPDHTMGRRVFESVNGEWRSWPPRHKQTDVYLPRQVATDARRMLALWDHLAFMESQNLIRVTVVNDGEAVDIGRVRIQPFRLAEDYVYAFMVEAEGKRILIAPDELHGWVPPEWVRGVDLAILPMGVVEFDLETGERRIPAEHPILRMEATFVDTIEIVKQLGAGRVILAHIEEPNGLGHDDLTRIGERLQRDGLPVSFAHDTQIVEV
jgi:phosphoribosyl 1,2-cyclic phosphate phosphodiesterase